MRRTPSTASPAPATALPADHAPTLTPPAAIARINQLMNAALMRPEVIGRLHDEGSVPRGGTPDELGRFMKSEQERWGVAVRESGATLD